jgi:hypothetical protein
MAHQTVAALPDRLLHEGCMPSGDDLTAIFNTSDFAYEDRVRIHLRNPIVY